MTKREIPRDADGNRVCEYCMERPVPASLGTKPKRYCSRNCRQRAYEARRRAEQIRAAVARGVEMGRQYPATSRDVVPETSRDVPAKSRDVGGTSRDVGEFVQVGLPIPEPAEPEPEPEPEPRQEPTERRPKLTRQQRKLERERQEGLQWNEWFTDG